MFARTLALAFGLLAGGAHAEPVTFDTATGPLTLPDIPRTIVALDIAAIDTITALGVTPAGVVQPFFVDYLDEMASGATPVGSLFEPDFEAIAALAPDVIVVGARGASQSQALSAIAPVANMSIGADALADGKARLIAYGTMLGREDSAQAIAAELDAEIERLRAMTGDGTETALILMTNGPKLSIFGPGSRFGWLHGALGFAPALPEIAASDHGEPVSFEFLAEADPDILLVIDRGSAVGQGNDSAAATLDNAIVAGMTAAQNERIVMLSAAEIYIAGGGVQAIRRTLGELAAAFGAE